MKCFIFPQKFCVVYVVIKRRHKTSISFIFKLLKSNFFDNIVTPLASFTVGFLAENTEQNLNFGAGLQLLIIIILIHAGSHRIHHTCTCFWRAFNFCVHPQITIRRVTVFNNYKGSLQMWCIDLIQQINKQVLHYFALYHHRKKFQIK